MSQDEALIRRKERRSSSNDDDSEPNSKKQSEESGLSLGKTVLKMTTGVGAQLYSKHKKSKNKKSKYLHTSFLVD